VPKNHTTTSTADKCAAVTAQIIDQLDASIAPWVRPWTTTGISDMPTNFATRRTYRGANVLNLWMAQTALGYETAEWMTFKQARDLDACVRKGEHGTPVFFVSTFERDAKNAKGEIVEKRIPFWKSFTVFNIAQIDGLPARLPIAPRPEVERLASVEAYLAAVGATVRLGGDRAFYSPATDSITLPRPEQFESVSAFYATSCHEHGHWSGAAHRLAREFGKRFGDNAYAFEELVAELTAAFLCAELDIPGRLQHPEYIANWAAVLRADNKAIWTAGARATEAVQFLHQAAGFVTAAEEVAAA
jgi:antirestriction protein ArdC